MSAEHNDSRSLEQNQALDASRRAFLKKAAKIAVYTPPAMLAISSPSFRAIAQSSGGGDQALPGGSNWLAELVEWLRRIFGG